MSEQEKKRPRIYDLLNFETKPKFLCLPYKKQRIFFYRKRTFKGEKGVGTEQKTKSFRFFLFSPPSALATAIKKDPTTSIRKHANELKVHEKTVRTTIKQDWSPDLILLDYALLGILENKTKYNFLYKYWFA